MAVADVIGNVLRFVGTIAFVIPAVFFDAMHADLSRGVARWGLVAYAISSACSGSLLATVKLIPPASMDGLFIVVAVFDTWAAFFLVSVPVACAYNVSQAHAGWSAVAMYVYFSILMFIMCWAAVVNSERAIQRHSLMCRRLLTLAEGSVSVAAYSVSGNWMYAVCGMCYEFVVGFIIDFFILCKPQDKASSVVALTIDDNRLLATFDEKRPIDPKPDRSPDTKA